MTALMKVYAFEKMSGRTVDMLPEVNLKCLCLLFFIFSEKNGHIGKVTTSSGC